MSPDRPLAEAVPAAASAYVITVAAGGRAHVAPASAVVEPGGTVVLTGLGRRTGTNLTVGSAVTVVWSTGNSEDYTVIVDGAGTVETGRCVVSPERAVLHRRAGDGGAGDGTDSGNGGCAADCIELAIR